MAECIDFISDLGAIIRGCVDFYVRDVVATYRFWIKKKTQRHQCPSTPTRHDDLYGPHKPCGLADRDNYDDFSVRRLRHHDRVRSSSFGNK